MIAYGGGSRGIGAGILNEFKDSNCDLIAFHRRNNIKDVSNKYLDADSKESREKAEEELLGMVKSCIYDEIIIIFLTGGSKANANKEERAETVLLHNYLIPTRTTDKLVETISKKADAKTKLKLVYISSAAAQHAKDYEHYCAAKQGLETYFKAKFRSEGKRIGMNLIRLGVVLVEHKYFFKLRGMDPEAYEKYIAENVHSGKATSCEEVGKLIKHLALDATGTNGIICDLSGGNSWT